MKYMSSMLEIDLLFSAWHLIASDHFLLTMSIVHSHSEKRELMNFIMTALYEWISKDVSVLASIIRLELFFKTITTSQFWKIKSFQQFRTERICVPFIWTGISTKRVNLNRFYLLFYFMALCFWIICLRWSSEHSIFTWSTLCGTASR